MKRDEVTKTDLLLTVLNTIIFQMQEEIQREPFLNEAQKTAINIIFKAIRLIKQIYQKGEEIHEIEKVI